MAPGLRFSRCPRGCGRLTLTDGELAPERIAAASRARGRS